MTINAEDFDLFGGNLYGGQWAVQDGKLVQLNEGYMYFSPKGLVIGPEVAYELTLTWEDNAFGDSGVNSIYIYSMNSDADPDTSDWWWLIYPGDYTETSVTFSLARGVEDYARAVNAGETRVLIEFYGGNLTSIAWSAIPASSLFPSGALDIGPTTVIGPGTSFDDYTYGGIAKAAPGIAIAAWMATDAWHPWAEHAGIWARAIRWVGPHLPPELGPLVLFPPPPYPEGSIYYGDDHTADWVQTTAVHPGHENSVYVTSYEYGMNLNAFCPVITVDPATLELSIGPHMPLFNGDNSSSRTTDNPLGTSWPSQQIAFIHGDNTRIEPNHGAYNTFMLDQSDGSILDLMVGWSGPPYDPEALAFHEDQQRLYWLDDSGGGTGWSGSPAWTLYAMDVTPTTMGTWTKVAEAPILLSMAWAYMCATPEGVAIFYQAPSGPAYGTSTSYVHRYDADADTLSDALFVRTGTVNWWDGHNADWHSIAYDPDTDNLLLAWFQGGSLNWPFMAVVKTDGTVEYPYGLDRQWGAYGPDTWTHTNDACCVGPGQYLTLLIGENLDYRDGYWGEDDWEYGPDGYGMAVTAWGYRATIDGEPLDNRRRFWAV